MQQIKKVPVFAIMLYSVHVPILFLVCIIVIAIVAACLIGKLFWSFHFRNKGLEPILKKNNYLKHVKVNFALWHFNVQKHLNDENQYGVSLHN